MMIKNMGGSILFDAKLPMFVVY